MTATTEHGVVDPTIRVEGLNKWYGDFQAVEDVSFTVEAGEVFGFLGPNGAGKSTVIRAILGFLRSESDRLELLGYDVTDEADRIEIKKRTGYLPSEFSPYERQTGTELLDYFQAVRGGQRRDELSETFDPPLEKPIGDYSTGNKQKLAFILGFMHDPELVLMDEPTSGLDPLMQQRVYDFVRQECTAGTTIFFSSHILSEVQQIADRVGIIRGGEMIAVEDVRNLMAKSGKIVTVETEEPIDPADFQYPGTDNVSVDGTSLELVATGEYDRLVDCLSRYTIVDLDVRETKLEDVFMHYYTDV